MVVGAIVTGGVIPLLAFRYIPWISNVLPFRLAFALTRPFGPPRVMRAQLEHLLEIIAEAAGRLGTR